jgi:GrpB-like predicted nucleotidyltransferase (UPF0157 family)
MTRFDEPIHLSPYDPDWPKLFAAEARRVLDGQSTNIGIEHIGSTSVPGLLAKPIIDIMLGVDSEEGLEYVRGRLVALGYEDCGEAGVPGRIYLRRRAQNDFNIALVVREGRLWRANIALRNYLRANDNAVSEYAAAKLAAVQRGAKTLLAYSEQKDLVVSKLVSRALEHQV